MRCSVSRTRVLSARAPLKAATASPMSRASAGPRTASEAARPASVIQTALRATSGTIRGPIVQATRPIIPMRDFDSTIIASPPASPAIRQRLSFSSSAKTTMMTPRSAAKGDQGA